MRVVELTQNPFVYTCRAYLLLGDWNRIGDVNTLIDPGMDDSVLAQIEAQSTGFGKKRVEQIIFTHNWPGQIFQLKSRTLCSQGKRWQWR